MRHWSWFTREVVDSPPLEEFKAGLNGPLSNVVWWKVPLILAELAILLFKNAYD